MEINSLLKKEEIKNLLDLFEGHIKGMFKGESVKLQLTLEKEGNSVFYRLKDQWNYKDYPENYIKV